MNEEEAKATAAIIAEDNAVEGQIVDGSSSVANPVDKDRSENEVIASQDGNIVNSSLAPL